jgi:hypothetical protein
VEEEEEEEEEEEDSFVFNDTMEEPRVPGVKPLAFANVYQAACTRLRVPGCVGREVESPLDSEFI